MAVLGWAITLAFTDGRLATLATFLLFALGGAVVGLLELRRWRKAVGDGPLLDVTLEAVDVPRGLSRAALALVAISLAGGALAGRVLVSAELLALLLTPPAAANLVRAIGIDRWERTVGMRLYRLRVSRRRHRLLAVRVAAPAPPPRRIPRVLTVGVITLVVAAVGLGISTEAVRSAGYPASQTTDPALEALLARAVHGQTGRDVTVQCIRDDHWRHADAAAVTYQQSAEIDINAHWCSELRTLVSDRSWARSRGGIWYASFALAMLAHESEHAIGYGDEAVASCYGTQRMPQLAEALGLSHSLGVWLQHVYWTQHYPDLPAGYRSAGCRRNGPMDLTPGDGAWP